MHNKTKFPIPQRTVCLPFTSFSLPHPPIRMLFCTHTRDVYTIHTVERNMTDENICATQLNSMVWAAHRQRRTHIHTITRNIRFSVSWSCVRDTHLTKILFWFLLLLYSISLSLSLSLWLPSSRWPSPKRTRKGTNAKWMFGKMRWKHIGQATYFFFCSCEANEL